MNKKIILLQIVICVSIIAVARIWANSDNEILLEAYDKIKNKVTSEMTMEEVSAILIGVPKTVVNTIVEVNSQAQYAKPIDEKSDTAIKQVHAVAGGMVIASGKNNEIGLFVKIKHENAVSTYGNLYDINVVPSERVQRSEIIGSFNTSSEKEFYYLLDEEL